MERHRADRIEEFVAVLVRSGLSTQEQAAALVDRFRQHLTVTTMPDIITTFCTFLVATETLTAWQCEKLRNGQLKGFFLDEFILLDALGPDADFGYFLARDTRDGTYVRLAVTPMARTKGPNIEYRVDHRFGEQHG